METGKRTKQENSNKKEYISGKYYNEMFAKRLRSLMGYDNKTGKTKINQSVVAGDVEGKKKWTTRQTISHYLNGDTLPDSKALINLSNFFNVSSDYLLGLSDVPTNNKDLQGVCEYTGLKKETIKTISDKDTSYIFSEFIDVLVAYVKENRSFINSLYLLKESTKRYQSSLIIEKLLSQKADNNTLNYEVKTALSQYIGGEYLRLEDKKRLLVLSQFKDSYIASKYGIYEKLTDILNNYSINGLYNLSSDEYSYSELLNDEKVLENSKYHFDIFKSIVKEGKDNEQKES